MKIEKEVKILSINVDDIKNKLNELGAVCHGTFFQKRYTYDVNPVNPNKWIRLRTNGEKTTLTIKEIVNKAKVDGTKEWEIEVSDFEETNNILLQLGFEYRNYQENIRTIYTFKNLEIVIDKWPKIPEYIEIEGESNDEILDFVKKLNLDGNEEVTTEDVASVYKKYGIDIIKIKELREW